MKQKILNSCVLLGMLGTNVAFGLEWNKIIECNDGAMIVDTSEVPFEGTSVYYNVYQAVIRDQGVVDYFTKRGFGFGDELVIGALKKTDEGNFFRKESRNRYTITKEGNGMRVFLSGGSYYADWFFDSCYPVN